jgi:hypothetical protein
MAHAAARETFSCCHQTPTKSHARAGFRKSPCRDITKPPASPGRGASEAGRLEPGDELTFPGVTCVEFGNAAGKSVPRAARSSDFAEIRK